MKRLVIVLIVALALADPRPAFEASAAPPTPAELDAMLAPIALYPDQLLAQMLLCAGNPGRVGALSEWLRSQTAKGSELQNAAAASGFTDSFVAIVLFPDVVEYMAAHIDWTKSLGQAFAADRKSVFDSIQRLRAKAKEKGALKTTPQQQVETKTTSSGEQVIVIEPSNPQVVYVPQYNPQVVYTQPSSTTVVVQESSSSSDAALAGVIGFTAGVAIGAAFDNNYYYGPYGWHGGGYMYNDAWDDYYDAREDAREDWQDHREDMYENRSDRAEDARENRSDRTGTTQQQRTERQQNAQTQRTERQQNRSSSTSAQPSAAQQESRGYSGRDTSAASQRSGTKSDAFSGYSSGKSERASSQRGQRSRSSSRSSGGSRRR